MNLLQRFARSESPKLERPFRAFCGYVVQGTGLSDRIRLKRSNYSVPFFSHSNVALTLWVNPDVIDRAEEFVYDFLKPGDTLIDVGANIGCVTAAGALAVENTGHVYSIEAHPRTFSHLLKTVEINNYSNVTCLQVALGAEAGTVSFTDEPRKDDNNRVSSNVRTGIQVECIPLAKVFEQHNIDHAALLKVDVEGFEMQVLKGAESILHKVDCLYIEVLEHTLKKFGSSAAELIAFLRSHGFDCYHFRDDQSNVVAFSPGVSCARWQSELAPLEC